MSYSFTVRAAGKTLALLAVAEAMAAVVKQQPIHSRDEGACLDSATRQITLLDNDASKDVVVACNGYLSWTGSEATNDIRITGASLVERIPTPDAGIQHQPV